MDHLEKLGFEFTKNLDQLLMKNEMNFTSNEFFQKGMHVMKKHKLLKKASQVLPKYFLTHRENRNRLMLNALNVHKKGYSLKDVNRALGIEEPIKKED